MNPGSERYDTVLAQVSLSDYCVAVMKGSYALQRHTARLSTGRFCTSGEINQICKWGNGCGGVSLTSALQTNV